MVERFNGRVAEVLKQTRFKSADELAVTLGHYADTCNHRIPQRVLNHLSPIQALKKWEAERPELFVKRVYNQTGLDKSGETARGRHSPSYGDLQRRRSPEAATGRPPRMDQRLP